MWDLLDNVDAAVKILDLYLRLVQEDKIPLECSPLVAFANPPPFGGRPAIVVQYQFLDVAPPAVNTLAPMNYMDIQAIHSAMFPPGHRHYLTSRSANEAAIFEPGAARSIVQAIVDGKPAPAWFGVISPGKAASEVAPDAPACSVMRGSKLMAMIGAQVPAADASLLPVFAESKVWVKQTLEGAFSPYLLNHFYSNISTIDLERETKGTHGYVSAVQARLEKLKALVDPQNVLPVGSLKA
eukprot:jgi/Mesvir1/12201/Mv00432-RA.1